MNKVKKKIKLVLIKDNTTKEYLYKEFKIKSKIKDGFCLNSNVLEY